MDIKVKLLLDSNQMYKAYIRSNSYWYKYLIRNPDMLDKFIKEVKEKYKLTFPDKIENVIDKVNMVTKLMNILR